MTDAIFSFSQNHVNLINAPEDSKAAILTNHGIKEFIFVTVFKGANILGILGCRYLNARVCELMAVPDVLNIKKYNKTFHKAVLGMLKKLIDKSSFRRFQLLVDVDFNEGQRWARCLGFEYEATLKKYSEKGKDQFVYVRFK
jgi:hypothetical protein